jgi:Fe-S cluster assembly protein SufB
MPVAVDAVFDSVSVATTFRSRLAQDGISSARSARRCMTMPELVREYLGSVVPQADNYFACLNSAVFTDGSFVFIPRASGARWN